MTAPPIDSFMGLYRWLSNFAEVVVEFEGHEYPSVEHAYQAAKTEDQGLREKIRNCRTAGEAKRLGSAIRTAKSWERRKLEVMDGLLRQKFSQQPYASLLRGTGARKLVEGNWWGDTFWGVCKGEGTNWLGRLIMDIRDGKEPERPAMPEQGSLF